MAVNNSSYLDPGPIPESLDRTRNASPPSAQAIIDENTTAIRRLKGEAAEKAKLVIADIVEMGRRLTVVKPYIGHGNWLPYLEREFAWTEQTARNFMRLYELSRQNENVFDLNLTLTALHALASPSTPQAAVQEVVERAEAGEKLNGAEVKAIVKEKKQSPHHHRARLGEPQVGAGNGHHRGQRRDQQDHSEAIFKRRGITSPAPRPQVVTVDAKDLIRNLKAERDKALLDLKAANTALKKIGLALDGFRSASFHDLRQMVAKAHKIVGTLP
jgi:hypothetical protein